MKQTGENWITWDDKVVPFSYVKAFDRIAESSGQSILSAAESLADRVIKTKRTLIGICQKVYENHLKTGKAVEVFSFYTFDRSTRIEYDTYKGHIRIYKATKPNPTHKDYKLMNLDFNSSNPLNLPQNEEEKEKRIQERNTVPPTPGSDELKTRTPMIPLDAKMVPLEAIPVDVPTTNGAQPVEANIFGDANMVPPSASDPTTPTEVAAVCLLIASEEEDDKNHFAKAEAMLDTPDKNSPDSQWKNITFNPEESDFAIFKYRDYYLVNDCGIKYLYQRKTIVPTI
jgi:hypothetical protein